MKTTVKLFYIGLKQISRDGMLFALLPSPFLVGLIFKFAVPRVNGILEERLSFSIAAWYGLVDSFLACLTPMFTAMVCAFLLLEERDEGIGGFYAVSPASGYSYLTARLGIPMAWAFMASVIALSLFNISGPGIGVILSSSFIGTLTGLFLAMLVVSLANNRVEGLAYAKLMGVSFLGLFAVWFIPAPFHRFGAFLPSFWVGEIMRNGASPPALLTGTLVCLLWIAFFTKRFTRRAE